MMSRDPKGMAIMATPSASPITDRVDFVARAIISHLGEETLTDEEWRHALNDPDEAPFIERARAAARVAIHAADMVLGPVQ